MKYEEKIMETASMIKETFKPLQIAQIVRLLEPTSPAGEMSAEEFEELFKKLESTNTRRGYSEKSIDAARLVLVMGASVTEAAAETGQTRQAVSQLMQRIKKRREAIPSDWVKVEQWFPVEVANQIENIAAELKTLPKEKETTFSIFHKTEG